MVFDFPMKHAHQKGAFKNTVGVGSWLFVVCVCQKIMLSYCEGKIVRVFAQYYPLFSWHKIMDILWKKKRLKKRVFGMFFFIKI
jgi:hypothetical protein